MASSSRKRSGSRGPYKLWKVDAEAPLPRQTICSLNKRRARGLSSQQAVVDADTYANLVSECAHDHETDEEQRYQQASSDKETDVSDVNSSFDHYHDQSGSPEFEFPASHASTTSCSSSASVEVSSNCHSESSDISEEPVESEESESNESESGPEDEDVSVESALYPDQLYEGAPISTKESLLLISSMVQRHCLSKCALSDLLEVLCLHLPMKPYALQSRYRYEKAMAELISDPAEITVHHLCPACKCPLQQYDVGQSCSTVGCSYNGSYPSLKFMELPVDKQLQTLFRDDPKFYQILSKNLTFRTRKEAGELTDVYDGRVYRELAKTGFVQNVMNLTFGVNIDGVQLFKSPQISVWPIYLRINELPPKLSWLSCRNLRKYLLLLGVWCNQEKPSMHWFLKPFIESLNQLYYQGCRVKPPGMEEQVCRCKVLYFVLDLPAKAMVRYCHQFNGKFGCTDCEIEGKSVQSGRGHAMAYPKQVQDPPLRSHASVTRDAVTAVRTIKTTKGIKGIGPLHWLNDCDVVQHVPIDYMHCILLGVCKSLLNIWLSPTSRGKDFFLGGKAKDIDVILGKARPPSELTRLPGQLSKLSVWKASQYRSWLLYFGIPVLKDMLPSKYWLHAVLLSSSLHVLLSKSITEEALLVVEQRLSDFVALQEEFYGLERCTMNVHMLCHIGGHVRNFGPLWTHSAFEFESANCKLTSLVHGKTHVEKQILSAWQRVHSVIEMKEEGLHDVQMGLHVGHELQGNAIGFRRRHDDWKLLGPESNTPLNESRRKAIIDALKHTGVTADSNLDVLTVNTRAHSGILKLSSTDYSRAKTRHDAAVKFLHSQSHAEDFGIIRCFIDLSPLLLPAGRTTLVALISRLFVQSIFPDTDESVPDKISRHIQGIIQQQAWLEVVNIPEVEDLVVVPLQQIVEKCVLSELPCGRFISCMPNDVELD